MDDGGSTKKDVLKPGDAVVDSIQYLHRITEKISEGGQGAVYRTSDSNIAVKVAFEGGQDYDLIRRLPIPQDINISLPFAKLVDRAGYVMQLLDGMMPLNDIVPLSITNAEKDDVKECEIMEAFSQWPEETIARYFSYYVKTGGIRRRLEILANCAIELSRLRAGGMIYCDINFNNIFISSELTDSTVWLIDADNIFVDEGRRNKRSIGFQGFMSPELARGEAGNTAEGDAYSFAVMAYWLLSMTHPFAAGSAAYECDGVAGLEGELPWILDEDDDSNSAASLLPMECFAPGRLSALFHQAFSDGRAAPSSRPPIMVWPHVLMETADTMIACPSCGMHYFYDNESSPGVYTCPYCSAKRPQVIKFLSKPWGSEEPEHGEKIFVREFDESGAVCIPLRCLSLFSMTKHNEALLRVKQRQDRLVISRTETSSDIRIAEQDGAFMQMPETYTVSSQNGCVYIWSDISGPRIAKIEII